MTDQLRVVVLAPSASGFAVVRRACEAAGHLPVAYAYARSLRPRRPTDPYAVESAGDLVGALPAGLDLLLPGSAAGLLRALPGYRPDLIVCNGFPWRLPERVRAVARLGAVNVHPSLLPRYRGPIPVHWAIRNGDAQTGVTVHWMDDTFDTGPVIAARGGVPIGDELDPDGLLRRLDQVSRDVLATALDRVAAGFPGEPQDEAGASYAGWMEEDFSFVDWSRTAREVHNQVRTFQFGVPGPPGPLAEVDGRWVALLRTGTTAPPGGGGTVRVACADGPLWVVETEPVDPPADRPPFVRPARSLG
ncbi:formyltransferase family protein [Streptomyces sp. B1866]|uniref:methionyl-tRNA formyltransferase n=1 Tax=Streptomyces sp. B1866 TaxID=3075431 RepID=UPI00289046B9|nr:formyltransferase family protein [Streptomyces sp. B1866]MDT3395829.1 formyltransferase family protein [Streptomyces sp. B1866]